jgi:hypothetical protein
MKSMTRVLAALAVVALTAPIAGAFEHLLPHLWSPVATSQTPAACAPAAKVVETPLPAPCAPAAKIVVTPLPPPCAPAKIVTPPPAACAPAACESARPVHEHLAYAHARLHAAVAHVLTAPGRIAARLAARPVAYETCEQYNSPSPVPAPTTPKPAPQAPVAPPPPVKAS